ncbi:hypothetical protein N7582_003094 [Saccharomyces uvarum]|uniref:Transcriptional regulator n=1 Tax=Saccharomyces uvarum TaxID=230603 RepID=A0AA35NH30_SACUV|nr:hypothetical protein N7582_003094 [Saccharomyces uvarum]CAI4044509.1 hypothetical protein SUVC_10G2190 [Saccharomyces uvarum]
MYIPKKFEVQDLPRQVEIIHNYPLGTLFTASPPSKGILDIWNNGLTDRPDSELCVTHVPFSFVPGTGGSCGKLVAHLAVQNQQIEHLEKLSKCLVVFQSVDSYISPSWYPLKKKTHKHVPTWDFAAVHVYGTPRIIKGDKEWLIDLLNRLTDQEESKRPEGEQYEEKWKVSDAPESYIDAKLKGIVGLEIEITHIESKFKFDQDSAKIDVEGVIDNLEKEVGGEKGKEMAKLVKGCCPNKM